MFPGLIDLASELVGSKALAASDEFFAGKENLLKPSAPVFKPGEYTDHGKWMDGWESRRKRRPGHDWCVIQLGVPGILRTVDVDTSHFTGNFPSHCSLDAAGVSHVPTHDDWKPALEKVRLSGGSHNLFDIPHSGRVTYVRLNIFPDGGVARLRLYGEAAPDFAALKALDEPIDLASVLHGGRVLASSDSYFGTGDNMILPGNPANMGGGWETRRRRGPGYDWIIVQLGARAAIQGITVETEHYKGNYPDHCTVDVCDAPQALPQDLVVGKAAWKEVVPATKLQADAKLPLAGEFAHMKAATHVRLNIYPDGGVSRFRVFGKIVE